MPLSAKGDAFGQNVIWNIKQIAVQFGHAENVNGRARSGYYKAAIVIAASVVEALTYRLLSENQSKEMPLEDWVCFSSSPLPAKYKSVAGFSLSICERRQLKFSLGKHTDFKKVNEVCFKLDLFSKIFFKKLEKVRTLRNKIHIQGLDTLGRSYTRKELEFISSVIDELLGMLQIVS